MCRVLNVARAGFYAWLHNPVSARDKDNQRLLMLIRDSYSLSGGVYGYRRVHGDLNEIGETCGKTGWVVLCNKTGSKPYAAIKRRVVSPAGLQWLPLIACNGSLLLSGPIRSGSQILLISARQGWLYLAVVIDLFARNVVGWSMKPTLSRELALDALMMAVWRRKPDGEVIVHSDRAASTAVTTGSASAGLITRPEHEQAWQLLG